MCVCVYVFVCVRACVGEAGAAASQCLFFFSFFLKTIAVSPSKVQVCLKGKESIYFFMRLVARFASDFA